MTRLERQRLFWGLFFISPWIIGFLAFWLLPVLASFYYSLTDFNVIDPTPFWVGLENYRMLLFDDDLFWISLGNTARYVGMLIVLATIIDVAVALLLTAPIRGLSIYRTIYYLPVVVPTIAAAMTWTWVLNPQHGLVNGLLEYIGIKGPLWLASPRTALFSLVLIAVWSSGRAMLIYLAGMKDVPRHLYEAAAIDGGTAWQRFWYITLPLITPQMLFNVVTLLIFSMQAFAEPYIMTQGGPANATTLYALYLYQRAFQDLSMGYASAMAWILFMIVLALTLAFFRLSKRFVVYDR